MPDQDDYNDMTDEFLEELLLVVAQLQRGGVTIKEIFAALRALAVP